MKIKTIDNINLKQKKMEKLKETYDKWTELNAQLYEESKRLLTECLSKAHEDCIDFIDIDECNVCVTYDGGNHPEYDANPYSHVVSVYLKDNTIYLNTEDCYRYNIENICASELYDVAENVYITYTEEYEK